MSEWQPIDMKQPTPELLELLKLLQDLQDLQDMARKITGIENLPDPPSI